MKANFTKEFEQFWALYPTRYNKETGIKTKPNKAIAYQYWKQMYKDDKQLAIEAVKHYKTPFVKDCFRWLRDKNWLDYSPKPATTRNSSPANAKSPDKPADIAPNFKISTPEERRKIAEEHDWRIK